MKVLQSHEIDGHKYERIERRKGWHGGFVIAHYRDNKVISRAAYLAAVEGVVERDVERGTCQICCRPIGVATGTIAHHGYKRPGHGWQTASCFGTHYRSLEVACDALQPAIDGLEGYIRVRNEHREDLLAFPPAQLKQPLPSWRKGENARIYDRPADFSSAQESVKSNWSGTYENVFWGKVRGLEQEVKFARADVDLLRKRLAEWKPAEVQP